MGSSDNRIAFSTRVIPGSGRRAGVRSTLTYRITPRLQGGSKSTLARLGGEPIQLASDVEDIEETACDYRL